MIQMNDVLIIVMSIFCTCPFFPFVIFTLSSIFCNFLQAARETGALKEAKDKLEKHVEELTWRLQLEKRLRVNSMSCSACNFHLYLHHL